MSIPGFEKPLLLVVNVVLTVVFIGFSVLALWQRPDLDGAYVGFCLAMFLVGMVVMVAALLLAIANSRHKEISLAGVFFLGHGASDKGTRNWFIALLLLQVVVSVIVAALAPFSAIVFSVLVPQIGFALMGLHGALYGKFDPLP